jgi:hypothetical protein
MTTEKGNCTLLIKEIEFEYEQGTTLAGMEAGYAAKVKEKTPVLGAATVSKKIGTCQITLVDGVPDVLAGDIAAIYALAPTPGTTPLLSGAFQAGKNKGDDDDDD